MCDALAVQVVQSSCHLTGDGRQFPTLPECGRLPPLTDQVGLEVAMGTVFHEDHDWFSLDTCSQQRDDVGMLEETVGENEWPRIRVV